ncbi:hypothetical protein VDG1235_4168 [Verrucomicrobiia bacterium DG1235]|nr:hypothetical protein VDG1235_4168 [Verrucomicrobiae bacterium DG1235]
MSTESNRDYPSTFIADCEKLLKLCDQIIENRLGLTIGSRRMNGFRELMKEDKNEEWMIFIGIDSETDHLPIGDEKNHWNKEILKKKEKELEEIEDHYRPYALESLVSIKTKYTKLVEQSACHNADKSAS